MEWNTIIQQFTGLKDSQDREIYEGDILCDDATELHGSVEYEDGRFLFVSVKEKFRDDLADFLDNSNVVGNIFENADLLC